MRLIVLARKACTFLAEVIICFFIVSVFSVNIDGRFINLYNLWIVLIILSVIYVFRERFPVVFSFLASGALGYGILKLELDYIENMALFCVIGLQLVLAVLYVVRDRTVKMLNDKLVPYMAVFAPAYLYCVEVGNMEGNIFNRITLLAMFLIIILIFEFYLDKIWDSLKWLSEDEREKTAKLYSMNTKIISGLLVLLAILAFGKSYGLDKAVALIGTVVKFIIKKIMDAFYFIIYLVDKIFDFDGDVDPPPFFIEHRGGEYVSSNIMTIIVGTIFTVVFICVIVWLLKVWIKNNVKDELAASDGDDVVTVREKLMKEIKQKDKPNSNAGKIRHYYRRRVKLYRNDIYLNNQSTCNEIQNKIIEKTNDNIEELTDIYELVRYGSEEISQDLVKKAKSLKGK